jgi:hypothetical protein
LATLRAIIITTTARTTTIAARATFPIIVERAPLITITAGVTAIAVHLRLRGIRVRRIEILVLVATLFCLDGIISPLNIHRLVHLLLGSRNNAVEMLSMLKISF